MVTKAFLSDPSMIRKPAKEGTRVVSAVSSTCGQPPAVARNHAWGTKPS